MSVGFYSRRRAGVLISRLSNDVEALDTLVSDGIVTLFGSSLTLLGTAIILFVLDARLALLTYIVFPILGIASLVFRIVSADAYRATREKVAEITGYLQETLSGMRVVRTFAQEPRHLEFLDNMDQPLLLLDGPAYRDAMARTYEEERELLRRLNLLPRDAGVVNIGRGALVDQDALCDLLDDGQLSGAVLDVFTPEPIPPGHRLWTTPNLIISPHTSVDDPATYNPHSLDLFFDNLRARQDGRPMPNLFDPARGY